MRPEDTLQKAIVKAARAMGFLVVMINNAGQRNYRQTAYLKSLGLLPGASDLAIIGSKGRVWWPEIKAGKGRQSDTQDDFEVALEDREHRYVIWRSLDEAISDLKEWRK